MKTLGKAALGAVCAFALVIGGRVAYLEVTLTDQEKADRAVAREIYRKELQAEREAEQARKDAERAESNRRWQQKRAAEAKAEAEAKKAEELAEAQKSYNYYCHQYGYNYGAQSLGAVSKYERKAAAAFKGMKALSAKHPALDQGACRLQAEGGGINAMQDWRDNKIEAGRW